MARLDQWILLDNEARTTALAEAVGARLSAGDSLLLAGPVGSGKSHFSRALIRGRLGRPDLEVPSPTFTLVQTYLDPSGLEIWHADLYRLGDPGEVIELGLDQAFETAICLIEWPDRLPSGMARDALRIDLASDQGGHRARMSGSRRWADLLSDTHV